LIGRKTNFQHTPRARASSSPTPRRLAALPRHLLKRDLVRKPAAGEPARRYAQLMNLSRLLLASASASLLAVAAAAQQPARPAPAALLVPAKTPIALQLETPLSTRVNRYGDGFAARVMTSVYYQGRDVIPAGSIVEGHLLRVRDARPIRGTSELYLQPDLLSTPDGARYTISAVMVQSDPEHAAKVNREGELQEPRGMMLTDVHHVEAGSAFGAVGGALLAGGSGAAAGAGVGAAVGVALWLVRHRHLTLSPGSRFTVRLERAIRLEARP
jgi:hypothetical protein